MSVNTKIEFSVSAKNQVKWGKYVTKIVIIVWFKEFYDEIYV